MRTFVFRDNNRAKRLCGAETPKRTRWDLQVGEHAVVTRPDASDRLVENEPTVGDFEQ